MERVGADRVLLVGVDAGPSADYTVRRATVPPLGIPDGTYLFRAGSSWAGLVCGQGMMAVAAWTGRYDRSEDSNPSARARQWFTSLWDTATPVGQAPKFTKGAVVRLLGSDDIGTVADEPNWTGETYAYGLRIGTALKHVLENSLGAIDLEDEDPLQWVRGVPVGPEDLALRLSHLKMTHGLSDTLYSYGSSKTVFRSYQFKPVLRLLGSTHKRLLIADEVGLGKTIEAGLVWTELEQRAQMTRVLVVCPSMLVHKWRDEMRRRFGRTLRVLDRIGLEELSELFRRGDDQTVLFGVVSLERLRSSDQLELLQETRPTFDLIIVDEAHYLRNPETASHDLGELLSDWADALLFLSATPLNLRQSDLFSLVSLLLPAEFGDEHVFEEQLRPNAMLTAAGKIRNRFPSNPEGALHELEKIGGLQFADAVVRRPEFEHLTTLLSSARALTPRELAEAKRDLAELHTLSNVVSRTRKADVPEDKATREPRTVQVNWTEEERLFYQTVRLWAIRRAKAREVPPGFFLQMPLRQTASCIPAMIERLADPALDEDEELVDYEGGYWDDQGQEAVPDDLLGALRRLAPTIANDTKYDCFRAELEKRAGGAASDSSWSSRFFVVHCITLRGAWGVSSASL